MALGAGPQVRCGSGGDFLHLRPRPPNRRIPTTNRRPV